MRWSDGQTYPARVLGQHSAPLYIVSLTEPPVGVYSLPILPVLQVQCSGGVEVQLSDDHIYSTREKLPRALQNKIKVLYNIYLPVCPSTQGCHTAMYYTYTENPEDIMTEL